MTNITTLLKRYYKNEGKNTTAYPKTHKAEHTSKEYRNKQRQTAGQKHKQLILDTLLNETKFTLKPYQIEQLRYWINRYHKDLKSLHRQSTLETIILALILIQYKQNNPKIDIGTMRISRNHQLTNHKFTIIQNRFIFLLMKTTPLTYNQAKYTNQEVLPQ